MSLARRVIPAVVLGGVAIGAVVLLDPAINGSSEAAGGLADAAGPTLSPSAPSATEAAASSASASSSGQASSSAAPTETGSAGAASASATADSGACAGDTKTGQQIMTQYGPVQVAGTVKNGKLCEVHAVSWPTGDHRSQSINQQAIPMLDASATAFVNGTSKFQYVGGATYTSDGYSQSLQNLLDNL